MSYRQQLRRDRAAAANAAAFAAAVRELRFTTAAAVIDGDVALPAAQAWSRRITAPRDGDQ